jgi:hypothetical protein
MVILTNAWIVNLIVSDSGVSKILQLYTIRTIL